MLGACLRNSPHSWQSFAGRCPRTPQRVPLLSPLWVSSRLYASSLCCRQGDSFQVNLPIPTFSVPPYISANLSFECLISTIVASIVKHSMGLFFKYATLFLLFLIATFTFLQFHSYLTSVRGLSSVRFCHCQFCWFFPVVDFSLVLGDF